jgi:chloride channel protein, CIC family
MKRYLKIYLYLLVKRILHLREKYIEQKSFIVIISVVVGILAGLVAVVLKNLVHFIQNQLDFTGGNTYENYQFVIYPFIGIALTYLYIRVFHKGIYYKGLSDIIYSASRHRANIPKHNTYSQIITSALTVGFGGSAGLEAPIVYTGSAIGVNTAKDLKLSYKLRTLFLACGAAGGISAIFNSPIAGVIFAIEVLLAEFTIPLFIPLLISSATASVVSRFFYKEEIFVLITQGWTISSIPFYILLGLFCGLISAYFVLVTNSIEERFSQIENPYRKLVSGGFLIGALIFLMPPLYGEGYQIVQQLLDGNSKGLFENSLFYDFRDNQIFLLIFVSMLILLKVFATGLTLGAGGNGGTIAPSLFTGALAGFLFARGLNLTGLVELNEISFAAVGMAGVLSGVVHAPLTGIFLIAEVTGGYTMIVPLMIVSAVSFFVSRYFEPYSVYTKRLSQKGLWYPGNKDKVILEQISVQQLLERDFTVIPPNLTLRKLVQKIAISKRNVFPVVDDNGKLIGLINLDDVREMILNEELYEIVLAYEIMNPPQVVIMMEEKMDKVMKKFEEHNLWNIPVLDGERYAGFVSKSTVFNKYREKLIDQSEGMI